MKLRKCLLASLVAGVFSASASAEVVKIAHIDPFSGPAATLNLNNSRTLQFLVDMANRENWAPGHTFQIVDFDNKGSPQETVIQLKNVADQGIHYVVQGLSSAVALVLSEGVTRYNERNAGKEIVYLNVTNSAPNLTNENCSYWHFAFDASMDMKMEGFTTYMAKDKSLKKLYSMNQNYAMGQSTAKATREMLKLKRPDIEIVGDDLVPMLQVKDFSPYVAKIKASGADAVMTSSWSADLTLFLKAAKDAGLKIPFYTINSATTGIPTAMVAAGIDNVKVLYYWNANDDAAQGKRFVEPMKAKYDDDFVQAPYHNLIRALATAITEAKSTAAAPVAAKLDSLKMKGINGDWEMRPSDHMAQQSYFIANWQKVDGKDVRYDLEKTGWGWKTLEVLGPKVMTRPTTCQMKRPS